MTKLIFLAFAGGAGTLCRVALAGAVAQRFGPNTPLATASVNLLGSFLFGLLWAAGESRGGLLGDLRGYLLAGFLGAFTTFSSLMFDALRLGQDGRPLHSALDLFLQNGLGVVLVLAGALVGRAV